MDLTLHGQPLLLIHRLSWVSKITLTGPAKDLREQIFVTLDPNATQAPTA